MIPRESQSPNPPRNAEMHAQDMYENVCLVDCCVFYSYPPPHRPPMRAKFRAAPSSFSQNFVPTKHMLCFEFLSCAFDVTNLQGVEMCDKSLAGSNLPFFPEILGDKGRSGDFRVFPCFAALKTLTDDGKENVQKCSRDHHLKSEQALNPTSVGRVPEQTRRVGQTLVARRKQDALVSVGKRTNE